MNKQSAVSALQSRIAKRQNELRRLNREREQAKKELAGSAEGFHRSFLLNDYRYVKAEIRDLVGEQTLDKTLQRGMTLLQRVTPGRQRASPFVQLVAALEPLTSTIVAEKAADGSISISSGIMTLRSIDKVGEVEQTTEVTFHNV